MSNNKTDFVSDRDVLKEFSISPMALWRWERDPELKFPPAVRIRNRKYRVRKLIEEFKLRMIRSAAVPRKTKSAS